MKKNDFLVGTCQAHEDGKMMLEGLAGRWRFGECEQGQESGSAVEQAASCISLLLKSVAFPKKKKDDLIRGKNPLM